jgi:hypothetical protein
VNLPLKHGKTGKFLNACDKRGPRHFNHPLLPPTDPHWCTRSEGGIAKVRTGKKAPYDEGTLPCDKAQQSFTTFEEFKNSQGFEDFYPKLYNQPHKVFPGRLHTLAHGNFEWWRDTRPQFDWFNVTNNPRESYFRNEPKNASGLACGPPVKGSRAICRVPPTTCTGPEYSAEMLHRRNSLKVLDDNVVAYGYVPLNRKYVPAIPRFPLRCIGGRLVPNHGSFSGDCELSMRKQRPSEFVAGVKDGRESRARSISVSKRQTRSNSGSESTRSRSTRSSRT